MLSGYQLFHNFIRPHEGLDGKTPSEACGIRIEGKKLNISHPEKGCNPRIRPISAKLLRMLLALPKTKKGIFTYKSRDIAGKTFRAMRQKSRTKTQQSRTSQDWLLHFPLLARNNGVSPLSWLRLRNGVTRPQIPSLRTTLRPTKRRLQQQRSLCMQRSPHTSRGKATHRRRVRIRDG